MTALSIPRDGLTSLVAVVVVECNGSTKYLTEWRREVSEEGLNDPGIVKETE